MLRLAFVLLLIALLLACPYRCAGLLGDVCAAEESVAVDSTPRCPCCAKRRAVPEQPLAAAGEKEKPSPSTPAEDCQCGSCLCHGAVVTDDDATHDVFFADLVAADNLAVASTPLAAPAIPNQYEGPPTLATAAGRPLRVVLESLQI